LNPKYIVTGNTVPHVSPLIAKYSSLQGCGAM